MPSENNGNGAPTVVRCAIYTRESTEEGLNQDFNSLDAQRDAGEAYVRSQAGEGWTLLPDRLRRRRIHRRHTMDRPARAASWPTSRPRRWTASWSTRWTGSVAPFSYGSEPRFGAGGRPNRSNLCAELYGGSIVYGLSIAHGNLYFLQCRTRGRRPEGSSGIPASPRQLRRDLVRARRGGSPNGPGSLCAG